MPLIYTKNGEQIWVDDNDLTDTVGNNQWYEGYSQDPNDAPTIYVRNESGERKSIPFTPSTLQEHLNQGFRWETAHETDVQALKEKYEASPATYGTLAAAKGAASGVSMGLSNVGLKALDIADTTQQEALHEAFPVVENVAEIAGMVGGAVVGGGAPTLLKAARGGVVGILEKEATQAVTKLTEYELRTKAAARVFGDKVADAALKLGISEVESVRKAATFAGLGRFGVGAVEGAAGNMVYDLAGQYVEDEPFSSERLAASGVLGGIVGGFARGGKDVLKGSKNFLHGAWKKISGEAKTERKELVDFIASNLDNTESPLAMEWNIRNTNEALSNLKADQEASLRVIEQDISKLTEEFIGVKEQLEQAVPGTPEHAALGARAEKLQAAYSELEAEKSTQLENFMGMRHQETTMPYGASLQEAAEYPMAGTGMPWSKSVSAEQAKELGNNPRRALFLLKRSFKDDSISRDKSSVHDLLQGVKGDAGTIYKQVLGDEAGLYRDAGFGGSEVEGVYINPKTAREHARQFGGQDGIMTWGIESAGKSDDELLQSMLQREMKPVQGSFQTEILSDPNSPTFILQGRVPAGKGTISPTAPLEDKVAHYQQNVVARLRKAFKSLGIPDDAYIIDEGNPNQLASGYVDIQVYPKNPKWASKIQRIMKNNALSAQEKAELLVDNLPSYEIDKVRNIMKDEQDVLDPISGVFIKSKDANRTEVEQRFFHEYTKRLKETKPHVIDYILSGIFGQRPTNLAWYSKVGKALPMIAIPDNANVGLKKSLNEFLLHPSVARETLETSILDIQKELNIFRKEMLAPSSKDMSASEKELYSKIVERLQNDVKRNGGKFLLVDGQEILSPETVKYITKNYDLNLERSVRRLFDENAIHEEMYGKPLYSPAEAAKRTTPGILGEKNLPSDIHEELLNVVALTRNLEQILETPASRPDINAGRFMRSALSWAGAGWLVGGPIGTGVGLAADALMGDKLLTPLNALRIKNAFDKDLGHGPFVQKIADWSTKALGFAKAAAKTPTSLDPIAENYSNQAEAYEDLKTRVASMANAQSKINSAIRSHLGPYANGLQDVALSAALVAENAINYLIQELPKAPSTGSIDEMLGREGYVSPAEKIKWLHRVAVVSNPEVAITNIEHGVIRQEEVDTLKAVYPDHWNKMVRALITEVARHPKNYVASNRLSRLLGEYQGSVGLSLQKPQEPARRAPTQPVKTSPDTMQSGVQAAEEHLKKPRW